MLRAPTLPGESTGRLLGIDVARGIAVVGMFAAHFNPYQLDSHDWLRQLTVGRSAALFAVLAGVSLALVSQRGVSRVHLAMRAVVLFALGLALTALGTPIKVILTTYAALFLLALPVLRAKISTVCWLTAALCVLGPVASFVLRSTVITGHQTGTTPALSGFASGTWLPTLLVTGTFPVLTWLPFLFAGMAIGRLDLRSAVVRKRLIILGSALVVLGYTVSWLVLGPLGGYARIGAALGGGSAEGRELAAKALGVVPIGDPALLWITTSHSGAPLEIVVMIGCAMVVIGGSLLLADRFGRAMGPLASVGALALTSYALHIVVEFVIGYEGLVSLLTQWLYLPLVVLIGCTVVLATAWRHWFGRGPLERLLPRFTVTRVNVNLARN